VENDSLVLRFTGNGILPSNTRNKEVAALLVAAEELVLGNAQMPDESRDEMFVSLVDVEATSLRLTFVSAYMAIALGSWTSISEKIGGSNFDGISLKTKRNLEVILDFVKKRNCVAEFRVGSGEGRLLATVTPETQLPEVYHIKSATSIIGEVLRTGGASPTVQMRLPNGKILACSTSEEIAKQLGKRLYEVVVCHGTAMWTSDNKAIEEFKIKSVGAYAYSPPSLAFQKLRESMPLTLKEMEKLSVSELMEEMS